MGTQITASRSTIASDAAFGDDVQIEADELIVGPGAKVGFGGTDEFRTTGGVRIGVQRLELGAGVRIGRSVSIEGGDIRLDDGVRVGNDTSIRVLELLHVGANGAVGRAGEISGRRIEIGQELWMLPEVRIGGGSAFETPSRFEAGHYLHLGLHAFINTARPVTIGHEVGLGTRTAIYTHGAYPSGLMGFPVAFAPVEIGDFSWIPGATINPGVRIGRGCVVGVNSLVTTDLPDGCLAAGSPARVIREKAFPRPLRGAPLAAFFGEFLDRWAQLLGSDAMSNVSGDVEDGPCLVTLAITPTYAASVIGPDGATPHLDPLLEQHEGRVILVGDGVARIEAPDRWTLLDTRTRRIRGRSDGDSGRFVNELRRYGVRFYSRPSNGLYQDWAGSPPSFDVSSS